MNEYTYKIRHTRDAASSPAHLDTKFHVSLAHAGVTVTKELPMDASAYELVEFVGDALVAVGFSPTTVASAVKDVGDVMSDTWDR